MCASIGLNHVLAPSPNPQPLLFSFQEQLSPLVPFPCHPLKSFQRIAGVCLGRNNTMTLIAGHRDILAGRCHFSPALLRLSLPHRPARGGQLIPTATNSRRESPCLPAAPAALGEWRQ